MVNKKVQVGNIFKIVLLLTRGKKRVLYSTQNVDSCLTSLDQLLPDLRQETWQPCILGQGLSNKATGAEVIILF